MRLLVVVGATYYLGARLGFALRFPPATTSVIWPPNALLTATLLLVPPRRWWLCLAAALPAHVIAETQAGLAPALIGTLFVTNCLEAILAAGLVRLWSDAPAAFDTLQRVIVFVAGAVFLAPLVSTFPDAAAVHFLRGEPFALVCLRRFVSNSLSELALVPSAVLLLSHGLDWVRGSTRRQRLEALLFAIGLVAVSLLVFRDYQGHVLFLPGSPYTALPFLMPLLVYAAVRYGPGGASLSLLATALLAIGIALSGWTPLDALPVEDRVMAFQVFLLVVGLPLLVSSALIEERRSGGEKLGERLRFEEFLSRLSGAFVDVSSDQMGPEFEAWLGRVAGFFRLDRATLWQITQDGRALVHAAWSGPRSPSSPSRLERSEFEWTIDRLLRHEPVVCSAPEDLPPAAAGEREILGRLGDPAVLMLPLVAGERVLGGLSFVAASERRTWSNDTVRRGRLVADVLAGALARKLAEDALRSSETMKSAVLASMASRVAVLDREGRIIGVNESWTRFARESSPSCDAAVAVGANYVDACREAAAKGDDAARDLWTGLAAILAGTRPSHSQEYRSACAADRWFHVTVVPLDRPDGGAVVSHTEVTERRLAEADAERSRQELAHFLRVSTIGEMTTSIAHELNQPLTAILANAQTARRILSGAPSAESRREVQDIVEDIIEDDRRAGEVIRGLRELLRKGDGARQELDVNALVRSVIRLLGSDLMIRGVTVRPQLAEDALVTRGDPVQLQQVLLNLLFNALEAVAETDGERRVEVRTEKAPGRVARVSVEDNGPGLPPPVRSEIFKPFFTTKARGMGMGLAITRSILEAHGGAISVDADRARGASFSFTLPLAERRAAEQPPS